MDYLELGPTPSGESCVQVGSDDYFNGKDKIEANIYRDMLKRVFPFASNEFSVKSFPHDFGSYREVIVRFWEGTESEENAFKVESNLPEYWDDVAKEELRKAGFLV